MARKKPGKSSGEEGPSSTSESARTVRGVGVAPGSDAESAHKTFYAELSRKLEWALWSTLGADGAQKGSFRSWANRTADMVLIRWAAKCASSE